MVDIGGRSCRPTGPSLARKMLTHRFGWPERLACQLEEGAAAHRSDADSSASIANNPLEDILRQFSRTTADQSLSHAAHCALEQP